MANCVDTTSLFTMYRFRRQVWDQVWLSPLPLRTLQLQRRFEEASFRLDYLDRISIGSHTRLPRPRTAGSMQLDQRIVPTPLQETGPCQTSPKSDQIALFACLREAPVANCYLARIMTLSNRCSDVGTHIVYGLPDSLSASKIAEGIPTSSLQPERTQGNPCQVAATLVGRSPAGRSLLACTLAVRLSMSRLMNESIERAEYGSVLRLSQRHAGK